MNKKPDILRETIEGKLAFYTTDEKKKLAAALGISAASLYRYKKKPNEMKLRQLSTLLQLLHVDPESPARWIT